MADESIQGGPSQPVHITNPTLPPSSGSGAGGPATIAEGADVAGGSTTDAAVTTNAAGTRNSFLRGLVTLFVNFLSRFPSVLDVDALRASLYAKGTAVGDTALTTESAAQPNLRVALYDSANKLALTSSGDGLAAGSIGATTQGRTYAYNGTSWDRLRTPTITKTVTATASGNTAIWTPTSTKKFRLMGYIIQVTAFAASAAPVIEITFQDAAADMGIGTSLSVPVASAATGGVLLNTGAVQLGNGKLSALANNVLSVNLSAALTAGLVRVTVWGTEE